MSSNGLFQESESIGGRGVWIFRPKHGVIPVITSNDNNSLKLLKLLKFFSMDISLNQG